MHARGTADCPVRGRLEPCALALDGLRARGGTVGLTSHVDAMKEATPAKLEVVKAADGASAVRVRRGTSQLIHGYSLLIIFDVQYWLNHHL